MSVLLETSYGDIVVDLFTSLAPNACRNFLKLCNLKYYNDCEFFLIRKEFIIQTGDDTNTGEGGTSAHSFCTPPGPSSFNPEFSTRLTHAKKGTVSMARSEQGMHASQFFITLTDGLQYLDRVHTPFGEISEGWDVVDKIGREFVDEQFRPYRIVRIRHTVILHDPFEDYEGLPRDRTSPEPAQGGRGDRLGSDEEADGVEDDERRERLKRLEEEREARSRAEVLEMIGDIADADLKPPENVLFICKLNPVTEAEDLEIIFSRFGECNVEILKDKKTGESLCYGFVEFEAKRHCEKAYFKMDGALIDDRRVKVDFSQSVSKLWNAARREKVALLQGPKTRNVVKRSHAYSTRLPGKERQEVHDARRGSGPFVMPGTSLNPNTTNASANQQHRNTNRKRSRFDVKPG